MEQGIRLGFVKTSRGGGWTPPTPRYATALKAMKVHYARQSISKNYIIQAPK
jgi:hypothetical protein